MFIRNPIRFWSNEQKTTKKEVCNTEQTGIILNNLYPFIHYILFPFDLTHLIYTH